MNKAISIESNQFIIIYLFLASMLSVRVHSTSLSTTRENQGTQALVISLAQRRSRDDAPVRQVSTTSQITVITEDRDTCINTSTVFSTNCSNSTSV